MANLWSTLSYGFNPVYWLTIGGIPVVFSERHTGLALPAGWVTEDGGALVIDDSAEIGTDAIDRERGIGTGLDLTFKLLDTPTVQQWLRRWSKACVLTSDLHPADATIAVDDNSAWGTADAIYLGTERVEFASRPNDQTFGTLTRGTVGTFVALHKTGTIGQVVTDLPRNFCGRDVVLWASFADPSGHICGGTLDGQESIQVWRGRITAAPERATDGFVFAAQSLDRVLDVQLSGKMSGDVAGVAPTVIVNPGWTFTAVIRGKDAAGPTGATLWEYTVVVSPFATLGGTFISADDLRSKLITAWGTAISNISGAGTHLGALTWQQVTQHWRAFVAVKKDAATYRIEAFVTSDGATNTKPIALNFPGGMGADHEFDLEYDSTLALFCPTFVPGGQYPSGVTINLTEGDPSDVPDAGRVKITSGAMSRTYSYSSKGITDSSVHLQGLAGAPVLGKLLQAADFAGATAEILLAAKGTYDLMALRVLQSSGLSPDGVTPGPRGPYDLLVRGSGYGIDQSLIDVDSFEMLLAQDPIGSLQGDLTVAGSAYTDVFGGVFGLFRVAIVSRPTAGTYQTPVRLSVVSTDKGTDYVCIITDADLLSHAGDPVSSVKRAPTPNVITVERSPAGMNGATDKLIYNDWASIDAIGKKETTFKVDATDRAQLNLVAKVAVGGHFAFDETIQTAELLVHPATDCEVGDAVWITTSHPALWTFGAQPGHVGYDGPARVSGKKLCPKTGVVTLIVIIDGALRQHALSPAALVLAWDSPTAPTWVEVPPQYAKYFALALAADPTFLLWHYKPGSVETSSQTMTINGAAMVGGHLRLNVLSFTGTPALSLTQQSTLTLPPTAWATNFQQLYAHKADGTNWG